MSATQLMLQADHFQLLGSLLQHYIPGKNVWAFGSRVKGSARESSDLDIVVFDVDASQLAILREALEESALPFRVDVHAWENLPENFHDNIRQCYDVLQ